MKLTHLVSSAAVIASLAFAAPAFAQHRGGGRSSGSHVQGSAAPRSAPRSAPQSVAPRASGPSYRSSGPSYRSSGPAYQRVAPRAAERRGPVTVGRAAPRTGSYYRVAPRYVGGRYYGPSYYFYSPWYSFRPRYSLGFGLSVGYPVYYPYWSSPYYYDPYYYDYGYDYPYPSYNYPPSGAYAYPPAPGYSTTPGYSTAPPQQVPGSVTAQNGGVATGGLSFDIQPSDAEVFVDGQDFGRVSDFSPNMSPLSLTPGRHHVEIRANGYQTMTFDTDVVAGQVIPYQGAMRR